MENYLSLFKRMAQHTATQPEQNHYMGNYAGDMEHKLHKSYFDFTADEDIDFHIAEINKQSGDLHRTDGTGYYCSECNNRGYFGVKYQGQYAERDCKCVKIRQAINQVKLSGLGDVFNKCTFNTFDCKQTWQGLVKDKALEFLKSRANCFYIGGVTGSGKSHICTAIVDHFLKQGKSIKYMQWLDGIDELNNLRFRQVEKYDAILNEYKNADVLYIDDFLKGDNAVKPSTADIKFAYRIINSRYVVSRSARQKRYITVISSEWALSQINSFDGATGGRISELALKDFILRIEGADKNQRINFGG